MYFSILSLIFAAGSLNGACTPWDRELPFCTGKYISEGIQIKVVTATIRLKVLGCNPS